jgi:hypothetical protein
MMELIEPLARHAGSWLPSTLDAAVVVLVALVLVRLRHDPAAAWQARETRLAELLAELRALAEQADGAARELDARLAAHHQRLRGLIAAAEGAVRQARADAAPAPDLTTRVAELAARALPVEDIARRLDLPVAEVRVLMGLGGGRGARAYAAAAGGEA